MVDEPLQICPEATFKVGVLFTVTVSVVLLPQPPVAPVTVYAVVTAGESDWVLPVRLPGFHV